MAQLKRGLKAGLLELVPDGVREEYYTVREFLDRNWFALLARVGLSVCLVFHIALISKVPNKVRDFVRHSHSVAEHLANPKVVSWGHTNSGQIVIMDDYLKGYQWIDANTPKDARVIAWWDYGYQITGIAKRTSIADGNTWNHEHIATLGRTLTSPEKRAWNAIRHLADYVLVWAGAKGDDLAKSPHLARIGNSVFPDHCGDDDPICDKFSFYGDGSPTPMMAQSLLYKLVAHNNKPGVR